MNDWKLVVCGAGIALAGVAVGGALFGAERAEAQTAYTRCIFARQPTLDVGDDGVVERVDDGRTIRVPAGWTPIGGGGGLPGAHDSVLVLCR